MQIFVYKHYLPDEDGTKQFLLHHCLLTLVIFNPPMVAMVVLIWVGGVNMVVRVNMGCVNGGGGGVGV